MAENELTLRNVEYTSEYLPDEACEVCSVGR
jgi:hypothetical protein